MLSDEMCLNRTLSPILIVKINVLPNLNNYMLPRLFIYSDLYILMLCIIVDCCYINNFKN